MIRSLHYTALFSFFIVCNLDCLLLNKSQWTLAKEMVTNIHIINIVYGVPLATLFNEIVI